MRKSSLFLSCIAVLSVASANADVTYRVKIRPGVSVDVVSSVLDNPHLSGAQGKPVIVVHGLAHTGNTFKPLAQAIFADAQLKNKVSKVILFNLPGHGPSSGPLSTIKYGDLSVEDYAVAFNQTLKKMKNTGLQPAYIVSHSIGALVVAVAQEKLLQKNSSLYASYGITRAYMLNASSPSPAPDAFADSGAGAQAIAPFTVDSPTLGKYLEVDDGTWLGFFFTDFNGNFVSGTPTPAIVASEGYNSREPWVAASQALGANGYTRPFVRANAFSAHKHTQLFVLATEQDIFNDPTEKQTLYTHLTGDASLAGYRLVAGPETVHDTYVSSPQNLIDSLR